MHVVDQPQTPDVRPIETLDDFETLVTQWHSNRISQVKHLASVPDDEQLLINNVALVGEERSAFIQGLMVALTYFETLPFQVTEVPVAADET